MRHTSDFYPTRYVVPTGLGTSYNPRTLPRLMAVRCHKAYAPLEGGKVYHAVLGVSWCALHPHGTLWVNIDGAWMNLTRQIFTPCNRQNDRYFQHMHPKPWGAI